MANSAAAKMRRCLCTKLRRERQLKTKQLRQSSNHTRAGAIDRNDGRISHHDPRRQGSKTAPNASEDGKRRLRFVSAAITRR